MNKIESIKAAGRYNAKRISDSRKFTSYFDVLKNCQPYHPRTPKRIAASVIWAGVKCARQILAHFSEIEASKGFTVIDGQPWSVHHNGFTLFIRNEISGEQKSIAKL